MKSIVAHAALIAACTFIVVAFPHQALGQSEAEAPKVEVVAPAKIFVLPLVQKEVHALKAKRLDNIVQSYIAGLAGYEVIPQSQIETALTTRKAQKARACHDVACASRYGHELDARFFVYGSVARLGEELLVTITLVDVQAQKLHKRGQTLLVDGDGDDLRAVMTVLAPMFDQPLQISDALPTGASSKDDRPWRTHGISVELWRRYQRYTKAARQASLEPLSLAKWQAVVVPEAALWGTYFQYRVLKLDMGEAVEDFEPWAQKQKDAIAKVTADHEKKSARVAAVIQNKATYGRWLIAGGSTAVAVGILILLPKRNLSGTFVDYHNSIDAQGQTDASSASVRRDLFLYNMRIGTGWTLIGAGAGAALWGLGKLATRPRAVPPLTINYSVDGLSLVFEGSL